MADDAWNTIARAIKELHPGDDMPECPPISINPRNPSEYIAFDPESIAFDRRDQSTAPCLIRMDRTVELEVSGPSCFSRFAFSPDGAIIAGAGVESIETKHEVKIAAWSASTGERLAESSVHRQIAFRSCSMAFANDRNIWVGCDSNLAVWRLPEAQPIPIESGLPESHAIGALACDPGGTRLAIGYRHHVQMFDIASQQQVWERSCAFRDHEVLKTREIAPLCFAFSADGESLLVGGDDYNVGGGPVAAVLNCENGDVLDGWGFQMSERRHFGVAASIIEQVAWHPSERTCLLIGTRPCELLTVNCNGNQT